METIAKQIIKFRVKNVYGNDLMYPANETAEIALSLTGNKTFKKSDLRKLAQLGFECEQIL